MAFLDDSLWKSKGQEQGNYATGDDTPKNMLSSFMLTHIAQAGLQIFEVEVLNSGHLQHVTDSLQSSKRTRRHFQPPY